MITYDELIKNLNILLVDDDNDFIEIAELYLRAKGYKVDIVHNGTEAIETIKKEKHQIILLDYFMPDISGEEVVKQVRKFNQEVIIIMQTGFAGQKPPIDTMQRLNIQNYHDKTDGMDKLNLELISAVKIFNQQNQIAVSRYKSNAISKLISSIVVNIKSNLMSIAAGIETTNIIINESQTEVELDNITKLKGFYESNKVNLEKIDKVLNIILKEATTGSDDIMVDKEIVETIGLILDTELKRKGIIFSDRISLRTNSYITGSVNDIIFILCEIMFKIINLSDSGAEISFCLTEDESHWHFVIGSSNIQKLKESEVFFLKNVVLSIKDLSLENSDDVIKILLKK